MPTNSAFLRFTAILVCNLALCNHAPGATPRATLDIRTDDLLVILAQAWAEGYMKHHTELFVSVRSGQGAPAMPSPRILANSDVCFTRRKLTAAEEERCFKANGWHPRERHVASAAVLVWVPSLISWIGFALKKAKREC